MFPLCRVPKCARMRNLKRESSTLSVLIIPLFLRSTEWLFAVTNTSIPFSLHAFAKASGEENCGYPEYGGPAKCYFKICNSNICSIDNRFNFLKYWIVIIAFALDIICCFYLSTMSHNVSNKN